MIQEHNGDYFVKLSCDPYDIDRFNEIKDWSYEENIFCDTHAYTPKLLFLFPKNLEQAMEIVLRFG